MTGHVDDIVAELQGMRHANLLSRPYLAGKTTLGELLTAAWGTRAGARTYAPASPLPTG